MVAWLVADLTFRHESNRRTLAGLVQANHHQSKATAELQAARTRCLMMLPALTVVVVAVLLSLPTVAKTPIPLVASVLKEEAECGPAEVVREAEVAPRQTTKRSLGTPSARPPLQSPTVQYELEP